MTNSQNAINLILMNGIAMVLLFGGIWVADSALDGGLRTSDMRALIGGGCTGILAVNAVLGMMAYNMWRRNGGRYAMPHISDVVRRHFKEHAGYFQMYTAAFVLISNAMLALLAATYLEMPLILAYAAAIGFFASLAAMLFVFFIATILGLYTIVLTAVMVSRGYRWYDDVDAWERR